MKALPAAIRTLVKYGLLVVVLLFVGRHVFVHAHALRGASLPDFRWLLLAFVAAAMSIMLSVWSYQLIILSHRVKVRYRAVIALWYLPMLGKYIPGKVWSVLAAFHLFDRQGVPTRVTTACISLFAVLGLVSATFVVLVFGSAQHVKLVGFWPCIALIAVLLVGIYPPVFYGVANRLLRMLGREEIQASLSFARLIGILCPLVLARMVYGLGFFFLAGSVHHIAWSNLPGLIALFSFAQIAGIVAVFAPAGIGVREGVFLIALEPIVGPGPAIVIAAVARLWQTALELLMAGIGWWALRSARRPHCANRAFPGEKDTAALTSEP